MGLFSWLAPGNDRQLAADLAVERRNRRSRSATKAARKGQDWSDKNIMNNPGVTNWHRGKG